MKRNIAMIAIIVVIVGIIIGLAGINKKMEIKRNNAMEVYNTNEWATVDGFQFKVLNIRLNEKIENTIGTVTSSGEFLILELEIKNISSESKSINEDMFKVLNRGELRGINLNCIKGMSYLNNEQVIYNNNPNYVKSYEEIAPNNIKRSYLVFDINKSTNVNKLDLLIDKKVKISLEKN